MSAKPKPKKEEPMVNLRKLDMHITNKAHYQAIEEWEEFLSSIVGFTSNYPTQLNATRMQVYGSTHSRHLSHVPSDALDGESRDALRRFSSSVSAMREVFVKYRTRHVADEMAQQIIEKANIIP